MYSCSEFCRGGLFSPCRACFSWSLRDELYPFVLECFGAAYSLPVNRASFDLSATNCIHSRSDFFRAACSPPVKRASWSLISNLRDEMYPFVALNFRRGLFPVRSVNRSVNIYVRTYVCIACRAQVTKEDMEAYRLTKANNDDPLANLSSDVLLDEEEEEGEGGKKKAK